MDVNHLGPLIRVGNKKAFEQVYEYYHPLLFDYLYGKTRNEIVASEVAQITFIKLWKYKASLDHTTSLSAHIFQMAKTSLIDELRKEERRLKLNRTWENIVHLGNNFERTYGPLELREVQLKIQHVIDAMPPMRKKVFELSRFEDMSHKDISSRLSISERTVGKHIQLAIKQLKSLVFLSFVFLTGTFFT